MGNSGSGRQQYEIEQARQAAKEFGTPGSTFPILGQPHYSREHGYHADLFNVNVRPDGRLDPNVGIEHIPWGRS